MNEAFGIIVLVISVLIYFVSSVYVWNLLQTIKDKSTYVIVIKIFAYIILMPFIIMCIVALFVIFILYVIFNYLADLFRLIKAAIKYFK